MISNETYSRILNSGLILDHYFILCCLEKGSKLPDSKRIQGFINLLAKKGYLKDNELTEKGKEIIKEWDMVLIPEDVVTTGSTTTTTTMHPNIFLRNSLGVWTDDLHVKCQNLIMDLTGKKQVRPMIDKKAYSFLPNSIDFGKTLSRVINAYKLTDYSKIEKALFNYIRKCNKENQWFPLMQYFIFKNGVSQMVTFMEDGDQDYSADKGTTQKFV